MDTNIRPTVISVFAGTGGSSLGYKWAGFKELLAIDFDSHAVECFMANFPNVPCWERDITQVTSKDILEFCNLKAGELDVFDGSPPCQGFSLSGKRNVNDSRNTLFQQYWRLICELWPKVFVMENVSGMVKGKMKGKFIEILTTLKSGEYVVGCKLMNSKYYGVPQSRERLIFIGVRNDLNKKPSFPIPSNKLISVKDALSQIKEIGPYPQITNEFIKSILHKMKPGDAASKYHPKEHFFNCKKLWYQQPTPTIMKTFPPGGIIHPTENRNISINEVKLLCSFPEDWQLGHDFKKAWARLGNAVMPKFMQAIAENIKKEILTNLN